MSEMLLTEFEFEVRTNQKLDSYYLKLQLYINKRVITLTDKPR